MQVWLFATTKESSSLCSLIHLSSLYSLCKELKNLLMTEKLL